MGHPLFAYPFRIFFLSTAWLAVLAVPVWTLMSTGVLQLPTALPGVYWHQHEMLAGLVAAAIAGFILTAVCAWTGARPVAGAWLLGLWLVWLLARLGLLHDSAGQVAVVIDLAFLPLVAVAVAHRVLAAKQWRQLGLIAVLMLLWLTDLGFHLSGNPHWLRLTVLLTGLLILVVGGRITPAFTRNWLRARGEPDAPVRSNALVEGLVMASYLALLVAEALRLTLAGLVPNGLIAALSGLAAFAALVRLLGWQGWRTREEPLLWILHLGMLWVPVGLGLRALAAPGWIADTAWLHALGTGAAGSMILGVMARVCLGHTGRPLRLPTGMVAAFWLVFTAGILRMITALNSLDWHFGVALSSISWTGAYALFLWRYTGILFAPRVDGRPG